MKKLVDGILITIAALAIIAGFLVIHTDLDKHIWPVKKQEKTFNDVNALLDSELTHCAVMPEFIDQVGC